jgi:hypothetical protein
MVRLRQPRSSTSAARSSLLPGDIAVATAPRSACPPSSSDSGGQRSEDHSDIVAADLAHVVVETVLISGRHDVAATIDAGGQQLQITARSSSCRIAWPTIPSVSPVHRRTTHITRTVARFSRISVRVTDLE